MLKDEVILVLEVLKVNNVCIGVIILGLEDGRLKCLCNVVKISDSLAAQQNSFLRWFLQIR